jgi:hypothetical protein
VLEYNSIGIIGEEGLAISVLNGGALRNNTKGKRCFYAVIVTSRGFDQKLCVRVGWKIYRTAW